MFGGGRCPTVYGVKHQQIWLNNAALQVYGIASLEDAMQGSVQQEYQTKTNKKTQKSHKPCSYTAVGKQVGRQGGYEDRQQMERLSGCRRRKSRKEDWMV